MTVEEKVQQDELSAIDQELALLNAQQAEIKEQSESEKELEVLIPKSEGDNEPEVNIQSRSAFSSLKNVASKIVKKSVKKDKKNTGFQEEGFFLDSNKVKSQSEFDFGTEEMKGIFKQDEPNLFNGEDLNTPAYARRK